MLPDPNKEYTLEELKQFTQEHQTSIKLKDGKIVSYGMVFKDEERLDKTLRFMKKYYRFIDFITLKFLRK